MKQPITEILQRDIPGQLARDRRSFILPSVITQTRSGVHEWTITITMHKIPRIDSRATIRDVAQLPPSIPIICSMWNNILTDEPLMAAIISRVHIVATGVIQESEPTLVIEGKNIGRANETNVYCQALRDAYGLYVKHQRGAMKTLPTPMLARVFDIDKSPKTFTPIIYIQRKYDGLRAIATVDSSGAPFIYGRRGLTYVGFPRIGEELARIYHSWSEGLISAEMRRGEGDKLNADIHLTHKLYFDGELYKHGTPLQVISGIVRRTDRSAESIAAQNTLNYIIYDIILVAKNAANDDNIPYSARLDVMRAISRISARLGMVSMQMAETFTCREDTNMIASAGETRISCAKALYDRFLREGYEGAILRLNAPYEHSLNDYHSKNLLKMKPLLDAAFMIVDYTTGTKGRARGAFLFICETPGYSIRDGKPIGETMTKVCFTVTPTGSIESRKQIASEFARTNEFIQHWRGKYLIVQYEALSERGVPQRARTNGVIRKIG